MLATDIRCRSRLKGTSVPPDEADTSRTHSSCPRPARATRQREEVSMENPRPEKVAVVDEVRERLDSTSAALLTEYRGLGVSAISELRRALRAAGGEYKIYKNTLVRFAARDLGLKGGVLGTKPLTADEAKALADVEPREVLLAKLAGAMAAPMVQFAGLLEALPRNFAYGLSALIDQQGGVPETPAEAPADAP